MISCRCRLSLHPLIHPLAYCPLCRWLLYIGADRGGCVVGPLCLVVGIGGQPSLLPKDHCQGKELPLWPCAVRRLTVPLFDCRVTCWTVRTWICRSTPFAIPSPAR